MATCPKGHESQATDYCDECGAPIGGTSNISVPSTATTAPEPAASGGDPCPSCGSPQSGRFCETCGYDFIMAKLGGGPPAPSTSAPDPDPAATPASSAPASAPEAPSPAASSPAAGTRWRLIAAADSEYHARMQAQREPDVPPIALPAFCPERRFALSGTQALVGRRSQSRGIEPEIDLSGPPADPAVSHAHALLLAQPDGTWSVVDLESANGTYLNDDADPIEPNQPIPLAAGDRVHVGAWTTLTVQPA